ncbi:MAG: ATP-binding protein, partial [Candidatus Marinimicrobia bacterium]|nr:ATP-binding protein [Candidatus Neomarinimicrobiota bacterium]
QIPVDIEQFELVVLNIVKNAIEAIESRGTITVITHTESQRTLTIRDTGSGISPEISSQIFTPFFSTKKDGQGIGLTLIREILINHGFQFSLNTLQQGCTEFSIYFP